MAKIKVLRESNLGNTSSTDKVYPVTSSDAVYVPDKGRLTEILDTIGSTKYYKEDVGDYGASIQSLKSILLSSLDIIELFSKTGIKVKAPLINIETSTGETTELITGLQTTGIFITYLIEEINKLYSSLKNLEKLYNELTDRVNALDSEGDEHWHSPEIKPIPPTPEPPTPPTPTEDIEVEITGNILSVTADNISVANNILSIPYESVTVNNSILNLK